MRKEWELETAHNFVGRSVYLRTSSNIFKQPINLEPRTNFLILKFSIDFSRLQLSGMSGVQRSSHPETQTLTFYN